MIDVLNLIINPYLIFLPLCSYLAPTLFQQFLIALCACQISFSRLFTLFAPTFPGFFWNTADSRLRCNNPTLLSNTGTKKPPRWAAGGGLGGWAVPSRCVPAVAAPCLGAGCPDSRPMPAAWCGAAPQTSYGCRRGRYILHTTAPDGMAAFGHKRSYAARKRRAGPGWLQSFKSGISTAAAVKSTNCFNGCEEVCSTPQSCY